MNNLEELKIRISELKRLAEEAKVGYEQADADGNIPKYLAYQSSWFKIQSQIADTQSEINKENYINWVINK